MDSGPLTKFGILLLTFFRFGGAIASSVGYVRISRSTAADECMGYEEGGLIEGSAALVEGSVARVENSVAMLKSLSHVLKALSHALKALSHMLKALSHVLKARSVALVVALVRLDVGSPVSSTSRGALPFVGFFWRYTWLLACAVQLLLGRENWTSSNFVICNPVAVFGSGRC